MTVSMWLLRVTDDRSLTRLAVGLRVCFVVADIAWHTWQVHTLFPQCMLLPGLMLRAIRLVPHISLVLYCDPAL